eukprot:scaffold228489_cov19-Tisochrysis_lutea.AAC.1
MQALCSQVMSLRGAAQHLDAWPLQHFRRRGHGILGICCSTELASASSATWPFMWLSSREAALQGPPCISVSSKDDLIQEWLIAAAMGNANLQAHMAIYVVEQLQCKRNYQSDRRKFHSQPMGAGSAGGASLEANLLSPLHLTCKLRNILHDRLP